MKKNQITYLIIFIAVFLIAIIGATYAYFESDMDLGNANLNTLTQTAGSTSFSGYSTGNIEFNINSSMMSEKNINTSIMASDNATVSVSLESENAGVDTTCTYDLVWVWDSDDMYTVADTELPYLDEDTARQVMGDSYDQMKASAQEFYGDSWREVVQASLFAMGANMDLLYPYELSVKVANADEKDLSTFSWNNKEAVIGTKSITSRGGVKKDDSYNIDVNSYNIPVVQNNLYNKSFRAHIEIRNTNCTSYETGEGTLAVDTIKGKYTSQGENGLYLHDSSLENSIGDNSYRYSGANPDNYVCFDGEDCLEPNNQYRIIGVIDNKIKLVKRTMLGTMAWNDKDGYNSTNTWEGSSLETYLNGEYLTSLGTKASMIDDTTWSVGGINWKTDKTIAAATTAELNNSVTISKKIGLMYVSDYFYAAPKEQWTLDYQSENGLFTNDWLTPTYPFEWFISRDSDDSLAAFGVASVGGVDRGGVFGSGAARPSFNLTSSVKIIGGSGTSSDPYILSQ